MQQSKFCDDLDYGLGNSVKSDIGTRKKKLVTSGQRK